MNRAAPVLAILLGLAGCDGKQLDNIPRSMSAPDLPAMPRASNQAFTRSNDMISSGF